MDTSETYIKMCEKAQEIQELRVLVDYDAKQIKHGDYYWTGTFHKVEIVDSQGVTYNGREIFNNLVWLPRQDQLQEMISNDACVCFVNLLTWYAKYELTYILPMISNSMEQLWLAFVMDSKFGKRWDGDSWVTEIKVK